MFLKANKEEKLGITEMNNNIKVKKSECNQGDIIYINGEYHKCLVDYCEIESLKDYISQRKSRDKTYFQSLEKLKKLTTLALQWESLR